MGQTRLDFEDFHWIDLSNPTKESLGELAQTHHLHQTSLQDCLESEHLPKFENINEVGFLILRGFDQTCSDEADTVQELTAKVAIFYSDRFLITIHRKDKPYITDLLQKYSVKNPRHANMTPEHVLVEIMSEVVKTYDKPVDKLIDELESFEQEIFGAGTRRKFNLKQSYYLKRKASVYRRMLRATLDPLNKVLANSESILVPNFQNVREHIDDLMFYLDDLVDSMGSLLNLHVSLSSQKTNEASHKTNEVMRVLTIFSVFFLPINFIASVYGMNFEFMPELKSPYGYHMALSAMGAVVLAIFLWFRRKGWLSQ